MRIRKILSIFTFSEIKFGLIVKKKEKKGEQKPGYTSYLATFFKLLQLVVIFTLLATPFLGNVIAILFVWGSISLVVRGILCEKTHQYFNKIISKSTINPCFQHQDGVHQDASSTSIEPFFSSDVGEKWTFWFFYLITLSFVRAAFIFGDQLNNIIGESASTCAGNICWSFRHSSAILMKCRNSHTCTVSYL